MILTCPKALINPNVIIFQITWGYRVEKSRNRHISPVATMATEKTNNTKLTDK